MQFLEFEQPIADLEAKIEALKQVNQKDEKLELSDEVERLEKKLSSLVKDVFSNLTDWQIIQLARHPDRPYALDYIRNVFNDFEELHGDRNFGDDHAIVGGLATLSNRPVMVIGQQKGRTTKEKIKRNFGMPHPEGYRKALRLMKLAERFSIPVITLIDTPGAYPGVNAEARGQSEAIARNLKEMSVLKVPVICVVIGEGCSGGALGIGVGDRFLMLNYSYFATISPEGCASILWKSADKASHAAEIMGITAPKLRKLKLIDEIIPEPLGGAHKDIPQMSSILQQSLIQELEKLEKVDINDLLSNRYDKIMAFGEYLEKK
ncbi:acetyl-CoA carboxylase carboxyl transferase subunit alpha [Thiotrichales bacterium 19S9-12]|nr:acetyl-CoA carboxylase carboxyl transferase subunit alpha [Thiotrichales bacterium 19S9-11]MCF6812293.1 acetyl-CoA carboxylase carboxyl transferase subunit alpha [Thiotrichales bacterium 19S9-12]